MVTLTGWLAVTVIVIELELADVQPFKDILQVYTPAVVTVSVELVCPPIADAPLYH